MIDCRKIGQITISGTAADILSEFSFITGCLEHSGLEQKDIIEAFTVGLFHEEIMKGDSDWEKSWDKIDNMVNEVFGKAGRE